MTYVCFITGTECFELHTEPSNPRAIQPIHRKVAGPGAGIDVDVETNLQSHSHAFDYIIIRYLCIRCSIRTFTTFNICLTSYTYNNPTLLGND